MKPKSALYMYQEEQKYKPKLVKKSITNPSQVEKWLNYAAFEVCKGRGRIEPDNKYFLSDHQNKRYDSHIKVNSDESIIVKATKKRFESLEEKLKIN